MSNYLDMDCENCGRHRVEANYVCEKCGYNNQKHEYVSTEKDKIFDKAIVLDPIFEDLLWEINRLPEECPTKDKIIKMASDIRERVEVTDKKLRLELHTLRFKESQEERFIWWVWNVYAKDVQKLLAEINRLVLVSPDTPWSLVRNLKDYTEKIYNGTYLGVEISTVVKDDPTEANSLLRSAYQIASRNGEKTNWKAFKDRVYEELVREHNAKTSTDTTWLENEDNTGLNLVVCHKRRTVVPPPMERYQYKYCPNCGREITTKDNNPDYYNHAETPSDNYKQE